MAADKAQAKEPRQVNGTGQQKSIIRPADPHRGIFSSFMWKVKLPLRTFFVVLSDVYIFCFSRHLSLTVQDTNQ